MIVLECRGGSDKGEEGHRRDTLPICDALRSKGWAADAMFFSDASYDECKAALTTRDSREAFCSTGRGSASAVSDRLLYRPV